MAEQKKIDKRIVRTRQWLTRAFLELLEEKGLESITVQDITDRADINRATFYAHYDDKHDLFNDIIDTSFQQKISRAIPAVSEFSLGNMKMLILAVFEYLGQLHAVYGQVRNYPGPIIETRIQAKIYEVILDWLKKTPPSQMKWSTTPDITASMISWAVLGVGITWSRDRRDLTIEQVADYTLLLLAGGLYGSLIG